MRLVVICSNVDFSSSAEAARRIACTVSLLRACNGRRRLEGVFKLSFKETRIRVRFRIHYINADTHFANVDRRQLRGPPEAEGPQILSADADAGAAVALQ